MVCVSIIIPVYNVEKYIKRCLDSLINQTLKDIEIICIDDYSPDNSLQILKEYAAKDSRIKVIAQDRNSGAAVARNKGLNIATGEFLGFIDPDDDIELNYYEALYDKAKETGAEIVKCSRRTYETDGRISYSNLNETIKKKGILYFGFEWTTAIYKSSIILENNIRFPEELIKAQDTAFLNKVLLKTSKPIEFVENVYYNYYRRSDSLNANIIPIKYIKSAILSQKIQLEDLNASDLFEKDFATYMDLFLSRIYTILTMTSFQNPEFEAKFLCARGIIDCYNICKDKETFEHNFVYKSIMKYIKNNNSDKIAKLLSKMSGAQDIPKADCPFIQKIFSVKNSSDKKYKIIRLLGFKIKIRKKGKQSKSVNAAKIINANIKRYKYVHIMKNDKFNTPFVDFLNRNFNKNEHMVLCYRDKRYNSVIQKFPEGDNVYEYFDINDVNLNYANIQKIIWHSLFTPNSVDYLYKNPQILKDKSYWVIWGGDLYNAPRDEKNDFVRSNFKGVIYLVDNDKDFYNELYASYKGREYFAPYIFPVNLKILKEIESNKKDYVQIQINNSCDKSTLEILDILSKFKEQNIKITTILSYGQKEYKEDIIKKGKEIFNNKFEYVENYMPPKDYTKHLAQNDILILNQDRQQGVGNILASLFLKAKVYIKKDVSTNNYFNNIGINVYDTENIRKESFEEFIENKFSENSKRVVQDLLDECNIAQKWSKIFYENNNYDIKK